MRNFKLFVCSTFISACVTATSCHAAPTATAAPLAGAVKLDGSLDEPAWAAAPWYSDFVSASVSSENAGAPRRVEVQTRFKVLYDPSALYVGVECDEPNIATLRANVTEHDGMVFGDDCVEIFFDPAGEGRYYHHFVVNTKGAWYDDYGADYGIVHNKLWECPLEVATQVDTVRKVWRAEVRIPFAALQLRTDAGANWLWNIARERYATGTMELSTWSPLKGNFHSPRLFGKLTGVHVDFNRFAIEVSEPQISVSGGGGATNEVQIRTTLSNQTGRAQKVAVSARPFARKGAAVKAGPVEIPARGKVPVVLPSLLVPRSETSSPVQIEVTDAGTGQPVKIVVKRLSTQYRPISVEIIQPGYRNNIYATQNVREIVFKIELADDVKPSAQRVRFRLLNDGGQAIREGSANVAAISTEQRIEIAKAPTGTYILSVDAQDKAGVSVASCQTTIRKLPPPAEGNEVRIDEHGNILVNGKPNVFVGWYGSPHTEDPRADVVALQNIQTPLVIFYPDVTTIEKAYRGHGIYSIVSVEPGRLYYSFNLWRNPDDTIHKEITNLPQPSDELRQYVKQLIDSVKGQPGLLGYYMADEPEINNHRSDYMERYYELLQELDPYHPVIITNNTLDGIATHGYKCCDILAPDPYSDNYDYVPNFMKKVHEVRRRGQGIMLTPWQSCEQAHFTHDWGTSPSYPYRVTRNQYMVGVAYGCRGFMGYTDAFFMAEPVLRYGLPAIWREVRFLEPAIAMPPPVQPLHVEANAEMATWMREKDGKLYLIAVNHKPGARKAKFRHPLLKRVTSLDVVSEGRQVEVKDGVFVDQFAEGDARIYTTDVSGRKLPTIIEVEKEIARQEAACIKPGNLLHISRGVRARASEGYYAPWFHQYYFYAINGITDDLGWHLSHTDKPAWLELTLPQEKKIGRVVVYTPNLENYDICFTAADGSAQVAEIRGNTALVAEHNFDPPLPTLKLRVTAIATRKGAEPARAVVREIEAYEKPSAQPSTPVRQAKAAGPLTFVPPAQETAGDLILWLEDFRQFRSAEKYNWDGKDDKWVFNPKDFKAEPKPNGGIVCQNLSDVGYAAMSHFFPYDSAYRYFQIKIASIEGEGYKYGTVGFGDGSDRRDFRTSVVNSNKPGIYTFDTYVVHETFRAGVAKNCYVVLYTTGSARFTYDWLRLVRRPLDGLVVTLADGSPLPEVLKAGDELLFRVLLEKPAADVVVEIFADANYTPLPINGESCVQMVRTGAQDGCEWIAQVKLGPGTGKFELKGYPVLFRAKITGGAIAETLSEAFVSFR